MTNNTITMTNTYAQFTGRNIHQARAALSYKQKGYYFTVAHKRGGWDGVVNLLSPGGRFPAGLTHWLIEKLAREGIEVEVKDKRPSPLPKDPRLEELHSKLDLWAHQSEAIATAAQHETGIIHHPTGSGKTDVIVELFTRIARPGLVLVHRKDLMYQTAGRFISSLGLGKGMEDYKNQDVVGLVGDGKWHPRPITIATLQTLYRRLKERAGIEQWLREEIGQVHVDECQHLPAASYARVMTNLWSAYWRYGYSATPYKSGDDETMFKVVSWLGSTIHKVGARELADKGHLVPVDVFMVSLPKTEGPSWSKWPDAVEYGLVKNNLRNRYIIDIAKQLASTKSGAVAVLVDRLEHGRILAAGLGVPFIAGKDSSDTRQKAYDMLRKGHINLVVISKIADEGLDIPPLAFLVMAGGGKAPHLTIQRCGRGMRASEGKSRLFVFDFRDRGKYLEKHAKSREKTYKSQPAYTFSNVSFKEVCP